MQHLTICWPSLHMQARAMHLYRAHHLHTKSMADIWPISCSASHHLKSRGPGTSCFCTKARCNYDTKPTHIKTESQGLSGLLRLTQPCSHSLHFILQSLTEHICRLWQRMPLTIDLPPQCAELSPIHLHIPLHAQLGASASSTHPWKTMTSAGMRSVVVLLLLQLTCKTPQASSTHVTPSDILPVWLCVCKIEATFTENSYR